MLSFQKILLGIVLSGTVTVAAEAQLVDQYGMGEQSAQTMRAYPPVQKIPAADRMFSKRIWRMIDLREKQNQPLFSDDREISKIIIEAVKRGELPVYANDSLEAGSTLTREEFSQRLVIPVEGGGLSEAEKEAGLSDDWGASDWGDDEAPAVEIGPAEYFARDLYTMELVEDVVFDKKRSRMYNQVHSMTLFVPADKSAKGIIETIGTFKYEDLVKVFQNDPNALWFNPQNDAQHKNMSEAFQLRLFNSYIVKVSNPNDERLDGTGKQGLYAAQRIQEDLIEFEYGLWSY